jgi:hypothetical protein
MDGGYSSDTSEYAHKTTQSPVPPLPPKKPHKLNSQLRENFQPHYIKYVNYKQER